MDADADANANANANADAGGSTTALRELCSGELKIHIQELWLLCSAHRLMMLTVILMKFYEHTLNGFKVVERT